MKKNNAIIIIGILFGIALIPMAYLNLFIGVALAFANNDWFIYSTFIYSVLGIIAIVGAALARRHLKATKVMLFIPNIINLASAIYLASIGILTAKLLILLAYLATAALGITALVLSLKAKQ